MPFPAKGGTRRRGRSLRAMALAVCAALVSGCSDKGPTQHLIGPIAHLLSPNGNEGAALIEFAGVVDSIVVVGGSGYLRAGSGVTRAALVLKQPGPITFSLPKATAGSPPAVTVIEVADGSNQLRDRISEYRVAYER